MNEHKIDMGEDTQSEVMEQAIYDMIMYIPMDKLEVKDETSIEEIIEKAKININNVSIGESILQSLIEFEQNNPDSDVLKATISNMSYMSDDKLIQNPEAFSAAAFTDKAGNKSVNFRGTPDRAWMDNADGLSGIMRPAYELDGNEWKYLSDIDKAALDYDQWIREDVKLSGKDITIGGGAFERRPQKIEGFVVSIKDKVTDAVKTGQNALKQGMDLVKAEFKNVTEVIKETAVNEIKKAADTISGALTTARKAVFDSADKIKDSVMAGYAILADTVAGFGSWLKETGTSASAVAGSLIKGTMTGKAGIHYAMLDEALNHYA